MYADDLLLLSISVTHLQKMLDICVKELASLDMKINVKKSNWLRIGGETILMWEIFMPMALL